MRDLLENLKDLNTNNFTAIPYEELSQWLVGDAVIKDAVKHWEQLGFFVGIDDDKNKEILAVAYDNLAHDFLSENERLINLEKRYNFNCSPDDCDNYQDENGYGAFEFEVVVFPIVRRVICGTLNSEDKGIGELFNYNKFLDYLEDLSFLAINYDGLNKSLDIVAEFTALISLLIERRFKKENK